MRARGIRRAQGSFDDRLGQRKHVAQGLGEHHVLVRPVAGVRQRATLGPLGQLADLVIGLAERVVVPHDGRRLGHDLAQLLVQQIGIFAAAGAGTAADREPPDGAARTDSQSCDA